jgi:hypothetical protein
MKPTTKADRFARLFDRMTAERDALAADPELTRLAGFLRPFGLESTPAERAYFDRARAVVRQVREAFPALEVLS